MTLKRLPILVTVLICIALLPLSSAATLTGSSETGISSVGTSGYSVNEYTRPEPVTTMTVTSFGPAVGKRGTTVPLLVFGTGFLSGATVQLKKGSAVINPLPGTLQVTPPGKIYCRMKIPAGAATGKWNLVVTNGAPGIATPVIGTVTVVNAYLIT